MGEDNRRYWCGDVQIREIWRRRWLRGEGEAEEGNGSEIAGRCEGGEITAADEALDDPRLHDDSAVDVRRSAHDNGWDVGPKSVERLARLFYTVQFSVSSEVSFCCRENCASAKE